MWNTSVKIEYIAGLIVDALENYSVNRENAQFRLVIEELRNHFTNCSEQEITDIISLCRTKNTELIRTLKKKHIGVPATFEMERYMDSEIWIGEIIKIKKNKK